MERVELYISMEIAPSHRGSWDDISYHRLAARITGTLRRRYHIQNIAQSSGVMRRVDLPCDIEGETFLVIVEQKIKETQTNFQSNMIISRADTECDGPAKDEEKRTVFTELTRYDEAKFDPPKWLSPPAQWFTDRRLMTHRDVDDPANDLVEAHTPFYGVMVSSCPWTAGVDATLWMENGPYKYFLIEFEPGTVRVELERT